jgi:glycosyltransferase involved in cell wall biosynthesis
MIKFSIIVPSYLDNERTISLVNKLLTLDSNEKIHEIIVVDNNKNAQISFSSNSRVKVLHCLTPGSYSARNYGVLHAQGDYVIFTDSDCVPLSDWFKSIYTIVSEKKFEVVAGVTQIERGSADKLAYLFEKTIAFNFVNMKKNRVSTTSNLIIKKELLDKYPFNQKSFSGGDVEWTGNYSKTKDIYFSDEIIVYHPSRETITEILNKDERVYGGFFKRQKSLPLFLSNFILPVTQFKLIFSSQETPFNKLSLIALACFFRAARFYYHFKIIKTGTFRR